MGSIHFIFFGYSILLRTEVGFTVPVEFTLWAEVYMEDSGMEVGEIGLGIKVVITSVKVTMHLI